MPPAAATGSGCERRRRAADLRPQQLEVNHHRVERVLHLVRDAGRQPAERHELARIGERRLHRATGARGCATTSSTPTSSPSVPVDRVRHEQHLVVGFASRRSSTADSARSGPLTLHRSARLPRGQRLLDERPIRMAGRAAGRCSARPIASAGSVGCIAGLLKSSSPDGLNSATASSRCSTADCRLAFCPASSDAIGGELLADGVEERRRARRTRRPAAGRA